MQKNWSSKWTGWSYDQLFACSDNPGQNIWNKMEKSSTTGQEKKSLSIFGCFKYYYQSLIS